MAKNLNLGSPNKKKSVKRNTEKAESGALVDLNFKVSAEFKKEFKVYASSNDMTGKALLEKAFMEFQLSHK